MQKAVLGIALGLLFSLPASAQVYDYGAAYNRGWEAAERRRQQREQSQPSMPMDQPAINSMPMDQPAINSMPVVAPATKLQAQSVTDASLAAQADEWEALANYYLNNGSLDEGAEAWRQAQNIRETAFAAGMDIFPSSEHYESEATGFSASRDYLMRNGALREAALLQDLLTRSLLYARSLRSRGR